MTADTARARVKLILGNADPVLSDPDLDIICAEYLVKDTAGVAPGGDGYVGTYDLDGATAAAFEAKAGRATDYHDVIVEGRITRASQVRAQCLEMAEYYRNKATASVQLRRIATGGEDDGQCAL